MANSSEEPNSIIQHYFDFDFAKDFYEFCQTREQNLKNRTDPNQLSIDFNQPAEINKMMKKMTTKMTMNIIMVKEQYFKPKLDADVKANSSRYEGRNVVWYGSIGNMIVLTRDGRRW
jgi:hypothetical protein